MVFGSSLLTPHLFTNERLLSIETNSSSNFDTSSNYVSPPIYSTLNATTVTSTEIQTDDYLLILRQNDKQQNEPIYSLVFDISQNLNSTEVNQKWFKSDLSITKSCSLVHEGLVIGRGGL